MEGSMTELKKESGKRVSEFRAKLIDLMKLYEVRIEVNDHCCESEGDCCCQFDSIWFMDARTSSVLGSDYAWFDVKDLE
jgi:hypothetical protein